MEQNNNAVQGWISPEAALMALLRYYETAPVELEINYHATARYGKKCLSVGEFRPIGSNAGIQYFGLVYRADGTYYIIGQSGKLEYGDLFKAGLRKRAERKAFM